MMPDLPVPPDAASGVPSPASATSKPALTVPDAAGPPGGWNRPGCNACRTETALFPFTMAFQPIVDLEARRIDGYEALVRGPAEEGASFVLGQVTAENTYAFDQACRVKAIELASSLGMRRRLSINFLPGAVYEPNACIRATLQATERTGFPPELLTFELLETQMPGDIRHLVNIVRSYHRHGFKVALDDFGSGHSSLARLADLRPDIVKLDREITAGCDVDEVRLAIVAGIVEIATRIGVQVVAEGAETLAEVNALRSVGIRLIQGFYFARPTLGPLVTDDGIAWP